MGGIGGVEGRLLVSVAVGGQFLVYTSLCMVLLQWRLASMGCVSV